jgi:hypothetical protein
VYGKKKSRRALNLISEESVWNSRLLSISTSKRLVRFTTQQLEGL